MILLTIFAYYIMLLDNNINISCMITVATIMNIVIIILVH